MRSDNSKRLLVIGVILCLVICAVTAYKTRPIYGRMGGNSIDLSLAIDIRNAKEEIKVIDEKLKTSPDNTDEIKALTDRKSELEQKILNDTKKQEEMNNLLLQMPGQFMFAMFSGFKDVISGALWVRADEFFHTGNYEEIIPLIRLVTWLDPHNIDVFNTGAWHMDYNFTDSSEKSDKRNIALAVQLLKEGIAKNPDRWDLYFELAWVHYQKKLDDYVNAVKYMKLATEHDGYDSNTGKRIPRPEFVERMLAHALENSGDIEGAIKEWQIAYSRSETLLKHKDKSMDWSAGSERELMVINKNLALLYLRKAWRYGDMDAYKKGIELAKKTDHAPWAVEGAEKDYEARLASGQPFGDTKAPMEVDFTANYKKVKPGILELSGTLNIIKVSEYKGLASECFTKFYADASGRGEEWRDTARVYWRISDEYFQDNLAEGSWDRNPNETLMWDSIYVRNGKFKDTVDFSRKEDKAFYPFAANKYKLTLWFIPAGSACPEFVQDRIGWNGESMKDAHLVKNYKGTKNAVVIEFDLDKSDIF